MARPSNRRNETAPLTVRMSPAERSAIAGKAERARMRVSDAVRAACEAWIPPEPGMEVPREVLEFSEDA